MILKTISLKEADEKPNHGLQTLYSFTGLFYECVDNIEESIIPFNSMNDNMNNAKQKRRTTVLLLKWIHDSSSRQIIRLEQSLSLNNYVFQWSNDTTPNHHSLFSLSINTVSNDTRECVLCLRNDSSPIWSDPYALSIVFQIIVDIKYNDKHDIFKSNHLVLLIFFQMISNWQSIML